MLHPRPAAISKLFCSAVKGKPGLFIRADTDLNEASFEQQRIEHYLAAMKTVPQDDPKAIQEHSAKLAATLALKPNADCYKQPIDQQVICLTSPAPRFSSMMDTGKALPKQYPPVHPLTLSMLLPTHSLSVRAFIPLMSAQWLISFTSSACFARRSTSTFLD